MLDTVHLGCIFDIYDVSGVASILVLRRLVFIMLTVKLRGGTPHFPKAKQHRVAIASLEWSPPFPLIVLAERIHSFHQHFPRCSNHFIKHTFSQYM
jgi:hypothetical protein